MASYALALLAAMSSSSVLVSAATPPGFQPATSGNLIVEYGNTVINGQVVPKNAVQSQPQIGTAQKLTGSSYTVIMVDLDIPGNSPGQTSTLLHWMQMGLTPASSATAVAAGSADDGSGQQSDASGNRNVFLLQNQGNTAAAASYIGPSPPARIPLSHRYVQLLVDTSGVQSTDASMTTLMTAAKTRQGFDVERVLSQAGLSGKVVAGNFFNVTNPGPAAAPGQQAEEADSTTSFSVMTMTTTMDGMTMTTTMTVPATMSGGMDMSMSTMGSMSSMGSMPTGMTSSTSAGSVVLGPVMPVLGLVFGAAAAFLVGF